MQLAAEAASWGIAHRPLMDLRPGAELRVEMMVLELAIERCYKREEDRQNRMQNAIAQALGGG